jgi:hypothetical protein
MNPMGDLSGTTIERDELSDATRAGLVTTSRLARETCGECVPHGFAPSPRGQMDQIQRMVGDVAQIRRPLPAFGCAAQ